MAHQSRPAQSIVIVVPNVLGAGLTGPAIRCLEMARGLSPHFDVTLAVNREPGFTLPAGVRCRMYGRQDIGEIVAQYDIVISQGLDYRARTITRLRNVQIFDMYDPILLELLAGNVFAQTVPREQLHYFRHLTGLLLKRGAYFVCATPQQRDLWLGGLYLAGRIDEHLYRSSPEAEALLGVVPFGHDSVQARKTRPVLKGVLRGIGPNDRVLLWGGGIWNWFDTRTLLEAMKHLSRQRPDIKLVFLGVQHPHEAFQGGHMAESARRLSAEMGLTDQCVFFNDSWVPYEERSNYLLEADLAVCTTPKGLENRFSFRTRLADALWAKLPYLCTDDGFFADLAREQQVGMTVPPGDAEALARRITEALEPETSGTMRSNLDRIWQRYTWENCLAPLVRFCKSVTCGGSRSFRSCVAAWNDYLQYTFATKIEKYLKP